MHANRLHITHVLCGYGIAKMAYSGWTLAVRPSNASTCLIFHLCGFADTSCDDSVLLFAVPGNYW